MLLPRRPSVSVDAAIVVSPKGVVQLAIGEQAAITGDPGTRELRLDPAVEGYSEDGLLALTRRIRHPAPADNLYVADQTSRMSAKRQLGAVP